MTKIRIDQFVPSEVCLKCDGCCRFKDPDTIWRPKMSDQEEALVKYSKLAQKIWSVDTLDSKRFIRTKPGCGEHLCRFLDPKDHSCAIYESRPFECELYPFVISRTSKGTGLYLHLNCPHVQETYRDPSMNAYIRYLKEFFKRNDVQAFLGHNRDLLNDYSAYKDELELVFVLEGV